MDIKEAAKWKKIQNLEAKNQLCCDWKAITSLRLKLLQQNKVD